MPRPCLYSLPFQQGRPVLISKPLSARAVRSSKADGRKHQAGRQKFTCTCSGSLRQAGPVDPPPDYGAIDARPLNRLILARFRSKMVAALREDVSSTGYQAIVDLTRVLNAKYGSPERTQQATRTILKSLFPAWLLPAFKAMFSRPMPQLSCKLNAVVTALTCQWLMGPCAVNDAEDNNGRVLPRQGVKIERCRYLEETGCASVCINSCKVPTQEFFANDMGLPLTMEPNYDDFSCQFSFGREPPAYDHDEAFTTPCFMSCSSKKPHRRKVDQCAGCDPKVFDMDVAEAAV